MRNRHIREAASVLAAITAALLAGSAMAAPKPSPGTQVVDSKGNVVGTIVGADPTNDVTIVARQTDNGGWISFEVSTISAGLITYNTSSTPNSSLYTNSNCTGTAYLLVYGLPQVSVPIDAIADGFPSPTATVYFPGPPFQSPIAIGAFWTLDPTNTCLGVKFPRGSLVGQAQSISLSFVPPFTVQ